MTTVDQEKGEFAGEEPLETLGIHRRGLLKGGTEVCFGENAIHSLESEGKQLRIGDKAIALLKK